MGILDDLIYGYRDLYDAAGQLLPRRTKLRVLGEGVTAVDNPVTGQTELTLAGGGSIPSAIVVDRAMLAGALSVIDPSYVVAENTITGTGTAPALLGETVLIVALGRPGFISEAGWYEVTLADGTDWTLTRLPGTTAGTVMPAGQVTLVRVPAPSWSEWTQDLPIFPANGVGVHEWVLPSAATMGSAVSGEQAVFAPAVDVPHRHGIWDAYEGEALTHPLATSESHGFMSLEQHIALSELSATRPIVVYTSVPKNVLVGLGLTIVDADTISGTGFFAPVGVTALVVAPYETGVDNLSGWYVVTVASGGVWTAVRMEGLRAGDAVPEGQLTICRTVSPGLPPVTCWVMSGGTTVGAKSAALTPLPAVGMPFVATTPAGISSAGSAGSATTVSRSDHVHAHGAQSWDAGAGLAHPEATTTDPGFMSAAQAEQLAAVVAATEVTGSRTDGTALASLLTALATAGIITDSTTA